MDIQMLNKIESKSFKKRPDVKIGDVVKLHMKIQEGSKERIQIFEGVVISIKGVGINKNIVVRKISNGVGVEKIVPLHLPSLEKIEIVKRGKVRRAKLFYIRERIGKKAMKIAKTEDIYLTDEVEEDVEVVEEKVKETAKEEKKEG